MVDRTLDGDVSRISPEAPIPVMRITSEKTTLGGAGNVINNLSALHQRTHFISVIGQDTTGQLLQEKVATLPHVSFDFVISSDRPTTLKTRHMAGGQQLLRADQEDTSPLSKAEEREILTKVQKSLDDPQQCPAVVLLSDYGKGVLAPGLTSSLIKAAKKAGCFVIIDPKGTDYSKYKGADLLTPNQKELSEASHLVTDTETEVTLAAQKLIQENELQAVLATRGAKGMMLISSSGKTFSLPTKAQDVFDVCGAGDTVIANIAAGVASGLSLEQAAEIANVAAGIAVSCVGTVAITREEIQEALSQDEISHLWSNLSREKVLEQVTHWKAAGKCIGFTNGCFDILHPGHISLLREARSHCDRLIIGLNTDASVQRLKGPSRPINTQESRAQVLSALQDVDLVVLFDEDTPLDLIKMLLPNVLVKGADYTLDQVVGADIVTENGGKVILADLAKGHSTTNIIQRIQ